jgi:cell division septation protein DedD
MSDQGFREIQLSSKQVVFLFMAGAVALVGTFLLGVSVGQGVGGAEVPVKPTPTVAVGDQSAPLPPATTVKPGSIQYPTVLGTKPDGTTSSLTTSTPTPLPSPEPEVKPTATPSPAAKPAAAAPIPTSAPAAASTGDFYLNVDSFSDKTNAERQVAELKRKGFTTARVYTAPGSGARYKSRVGPFDLQEANAMIARLRKAGYKPSAPIR